MNKKIKHFIVYALCLPTITGGVFCILKVNYDMLTKGTVNHNGLLLQQALIMIIGIVIYLFYCKKNKIF